MPSLDQLLVRVVERKGYTVQGADSGALYAKRGDESLLMAWSLDGPVTTSDAGIFLTAMEQVHATTGILVAPKGIEPAAKEALAPHGVEAWPESRLIVEVGEAAVRDAYEATHPAAAAPAAPAHLPVAGPAAPAKPRAFPSLVAQAVTAAQPSGNGNAMFMSNKPTKTADNTATIAQKGQSLGYAWGGGGTTAHNAGIAQIREGRHPRIKTDQWGNVVDPAKAAAAAAARTPVAVADDDVEIVTTPKKRGASAATPAAPMPAAFAPAEEEGYEIMTTKKPAAAAAKATPAPAAPPSSALKIKISKEEAAQKGGFKGAAKLTLVPHVVFTYDLHMERDSLPAPVEAAGAILISSLTGELRAVDGLDYAASEPTDARKDQPKLQAVDVYDKVKGYMAKTFTRTMNVERDVAGNTVMESVKLSPDPDEMNLQHLGILYVPAWEAAGANGVVKVDAYTGAVL